MRNKSKIFDVDMWHGTIILSFMRLKLINLVEGASKFNKKFLYRRILEKNQNINPFVVVNLETHLPFSLNPTKVRGTFPTPIKKCQLHLKTMIVKSPNFVTFPIYLWQTLPYPFGPQKCQKYMGFQRFCCPTYQIRNIFVHKLN